MKSIKEGIEAASAGGRSVGYAVGLYHAMLIARKKFEEIFGEVLDEEDHKLLLVLQAEFQSALEKGEETTKKEYNIA